MTTFKLGKTAARPDSVTLKFSDYLTTALPAIPKKVTGHSSLVTADWGMLGNDSYGDCVWAGAGHETMLWNAEQKKIVSFTDKSVLSDYSKVTGFNPNDPNSDQGTDMQKAASYRLKTGVLDSAGKRHKVDAYVALDAGDIDQLRAAIYLFGAVGVGVNFPSPWMDLFNEGKVWGYKAAYKKQIDGGHYIPAVASASPTGNITVLTWGQTQLMSATAYKNFNDESIAYVSVEALNASGKSLEGFNITQLLADVKAVSKL